MTYKKKYAWLAAAVVAVIAYLSFYTVRETEFALITQFGRPVRTVFDAGLHVKWFYQSILRFDRRLRIYNPRPSEFLTRDKKNLVIENYVAWRIDDPDRFVQTVGDVSSAEMRLHDIIWSDLSAAFGNQDLESLVSASPDKLQTTALLDNITANGDRAALARASTAVRPTNRSG